MQSKFVGKCALCDGLIPEGAQILFDATAPKGKRVRHAPACPTGQQQGEQQQQQGKGQGEQGEQGEQQQQQDQSQQAPNNKEWQKMLDAAGITRPHPMLRKVHALAIVARLHVMLVGPAGCGKTMLAEQLAQLMGYRFGLNSMTAGTSESALTGWLLPIGEAGKFEYVPAPFVTNYAEGKSVHLLDEADAADANLLLVMNAALANGHLPIPHNLKSPMVKRSDSNHILAACNTTGSGADDLYTGRTALDASTLDRFYMVRVDYAADYEASVFAAETAKPRQWNPNSSKPTADDYRSAHEWLTGLRRKVHSLKIPRIVSTRMFQKVRAALDAGLAIKEIKADLLMAWSPDELRRAHEAI
jgi:MoxR-like ATPase